MPRGPQRRIEPPDLREFGEAPIPPGTLRFSHYTWGRNVEGIKEHGLKRSYSEEKFEHGGTESPQVFATAGIGKNTLRDAVGGDKHYVEGYAYPHQLDIGAPFRHEHMSTAQLGEHFAEREARNSTVTMHGDIPPEQIIKVHAPWEQSYKHLMRERAKPGYPYTGIERGVMHGRYDNIEPGLDTALRHAKTALAAKVMLGGKLEGPEDD